MKAFYQLACLFQLLELPAFNCFPLRRRWSPFALNSKAFRPQKEGNLTFRGTISTDGIGLTHHRCRPRYL
ncbi:hypothetical protein BX666DRAFT_1906096 [Dichotomocladium elegans]|nr:hypothetical protein BX666DRAFT_1906096 [Dichotomocladium elegans]